MYIDIRLEIILDEVFSANPCLDLVV